MQDSGSLAVFKGTARDQGHYKGPSGAFVTYCNISNSFDDPFLPICSFVYPFCRSDLGPHNLDSEVYISTKKKAYEKRSRKG